MTILLLIVGIGMTVVNIGNGEMQETQDILENLLETETSLVGKFQEYIEYQQQQLTTLSNVEYYSRELVEVSRSVNQHLTDAKNTFVMLKRLKTLWKEIDDFLTEAASEDCLVNVTSSENEYSTVPVYDDLENGVFDDFSQMLCKGEISLSADVKKDLKCRYTDRGIPFLKIAPFKQEEIYLDPEIILYHDVITDEEIETLQNLAYPMLKASLVRFGPHGAHQSKIRTSENAWLVDEDHKHVATVNRRAEHMSDLNVVTAEDLQISYYKRGGYFNIHADFAQNKENPFPDFGMGNRIATVMFYLNDVQEGGSTIFPAINVTLTPKKGNAVFWYNLFPNGELDYGTEHAGCRVISGTKWVANKWLHELGQEFRRPCTLENFEYDENGTLIITPELPATLPTFPEAPKLPVSLLKVS